VDRRERSRNHGRTVADACFDRFVAGRPALKLTGLAIPMLIVSLTVAAVGGLGTLAVRASAVSTQTSIELLRMNLRVAQLHEQILRHSRDALAAQVQASLPRGSVPTAEKVSTWPEASPVEPWPEEVTP
jgi:hypothetical protein